ncbi:hypothetical protein SAMN04489727_1894 [Amycolatopsis tolypomycina]|uniref:Uncharacterized protein n=1 Tax=Amycolatopsis tolypomycina TaxID=208445 RepID=A0A1H4JGV1_9PSEU|nr:hypothetical protein [Amycolatopsis tolypomycina]SEB45589.1 hypothetical protein SAMN04489727_1894 [Amycolatopsis tolypomycina]
MVDDPSKASDSEFDAWLSGLNNAYDRSVSDAYNLSQLSDDTDDAELHLVHDHHEPQNIADQDVPPQAAMTSTDQTRNLPLPKPRPRGETPAGDLLLARVQELDYRAARALDGHVVGPHGQNLTVGEAQARAELIDRLIELEQLRGSLRHRRVGRLARVLTLLTVVVVDLPIMLWLASSLFNIDWSNPVGLPLAISVVISVLATGGAATALHYLGHNLRQNKNHRRQLDWAKVSSGSKLSLATIGLLAGLRGVVMFVRVYAEGVLSGMNGLAVLLAVLVALVTVVSATLVFWTAFRDGSLEQDDLRHYSESVRPFLAAKREYEDQAHELRCQYDLLHRRAKYKTSRENEISTTTQHESGCGNSPQG